MDPFRIGKEIDLICGQVEKVEYKPSGSLLITKKTLRQVTNLLQLKSFTAQNIPINAQVAWGQQISYGKLYAPEFSQDTLDELLDILKRLKIIF